MSRPSKLSAADVASIVADRARGVPWKILQRRYDLSRSQLDRVWRRATGRIPGHLRGIPGHLARGRAA